MFRQPVGRRKRLPHQCWISGLFVSALAVHWKPKTLLVVLLLAWIHAVPAYEALHTPFVNLTWQHAQVKIDHPFADMGVLFPPDTHESKLTYRLTVPLLAHVLRFGRNGLIVVSAAAGVLLLYLILSLGFSLTGSRKTAIFVCLAVACSWAGESAFHEVRGGYYDAIAVCLLILSMSTTRPFLIGSFVFLAGWTDERALLASSFVFLFWWLGNRLMSPRPAAVVAAWAAYLATRACLTIAFSLTPVTTVGVGPALLAQQFFLLPLALWSGLAGTWLPLAYSLSALIREKRLAAAASSAFFLVLVIVGAMSVIDVTRSMAYCLPALITTLRYSGGRQNSTLQRVAISGGVLSFLVPGCYLEGIAGFWWLHPLPWQIFH